MSLILEALKKLERERHAHERGFLVLGQPGWAPAGEGRSARGPLLMGAAALAGATAAAALLWPTRAAQAPAPAAVATRDVRPPAAAPAHLPAAASPADTAGPASTTAPPPRVAWPAAAVATDAGAATDATVRPGEPAAHGTMPSAPDATRSRPSAAEPAPASRPAEIESNVEPAAEGDEAPALEPAPPSGPLRLEAISQRDGQPVAVVSGQLVRVGDPIGAGTVVRIGVNEIEIETDGVRRVLRF